LESQPYIYTDSKQICRSSCWRNPMSCLLESYFSRHNVTNRCERAWSCVKEIPKFVGSLAEEYILLIEADTHIEQKRVILRLASMPTAPGWNKCSIQPCSLLMTKFIILTLRMSR